MVAERSSNIRKWVVMVAVGSWSLMTAAAEREAAEMGEEDREWVDMGCRRQSTLCSLVGL